MMQNVEIEGTLGTRPGPLSRKDHFFSAFVESQGPCLVQARVDKPSTHGICVVEVYLLTKPFLRPKHSVQSTPVLRASQVR